MSLPDSVVKLLEERRDAGLAVGFMPWSDLQGILWGYVKTIGPSSVEFDLVHVDGSFNKTSSYDFSRIFHFDFDIHYATRLKRLGQKVWPEGRTQLIKKASDRDAILRIALETGNPIYCGYGSNTAFFFDAKVIAMEGEWVVLQRMEDDGTLREEFEATRRSKIKIKTGPLDEAMAWLATERNS